MRRLLLLAALVSCRSPVAAATPSVSASRPVDDPHCENVTFPSAGASVLVIPGETMTRALAPVVRAACACSRSGDRVRLTATIVPEDGVVTAVVHDDAAVDACMAMLDGRFEPFDLGSDCIDCGAKRYPVFGASPPRRARSRITYPFTLVHP